MNQGFESSQHPHENETEKQARDFNVGDIVKVDDGTANSAFPWFVVERLDISGFYVLCPEGLDATDPNNLHAFVKEQVVAPSKSEHLPDHTSEKHMKELGKVNKVTIIDTVMDAQTTIIVEKLQPLSAEGEPIDAETVEDIGEVAVKDEVSTEENEVAVETVEQEPGVRTHEVYLERIQDIENEIKKELPQAIEVLKSNANVDVHLKHLLEGVKADASLLAQLLQIDDPKEFRIKAAAVEARFHSARRGLRSFNSQIIGEVTFSSNRVDRKILEQSDFAKKLDTTYSQVLNEEQTDSLSIEEAQEATDAVDALAGKLEPFLTDVPKILDVAQTKTENLDTNLRLCSEELQKMILRSYDNLEEVNPSELEEIANMIEQLERYDPDSRANQDHLRDIKTSITAAYNALDGVTKPAPGFTKSKIKTLR